MTAVFQTVLSLSLSGSVLILALAVIRPLYRERLSKRWQYYIWLVVIARMLIPFAPETNLVGTLFQEFGQETLQEEPAGAPDSPSAPPTEISESVRIPGAGAPEAHAVLFRQNLWVIWLLIAAVLMVRKITIYQSFGNYVRTGCRAVEDFAVLERLGKLLDHYHLKCPVELYTNRTISSPLLIGFFRPRIVLPAVDLPEPDFQYTIQHELTHVRRGDMFYQWLVQFTVCLHWFNPLVYWMLREINRNGELSCDEAVIRALNYEEKRRYGDTLLSAAKTGNSYKKNCPAPLMLNEGKELLMERLGAIMSYQKKSKRCTAVSAMIAFAFCLGGMVLGAAAVNPPGMPGESSGTNESHREFQEVFISGRGPVGVELVKSEKNTVDFDFFGFDNEKNCSASAKAAGNTMKISINHTVSTISKDLQVNFGPDYRNVVRVWIPDVEYQKFEIQSSEMVIHMQDFHAPVRAKLDHAGLYLIDSEISRGTYEMDVSYGPAYIEADSILTDITADVSNGPLSVKFRKPPENLYLDTRNCGPVVDLPDTWPAITRLGNETPKLILSGYGMTTIETK